MASHNKLTSMRIKEFLVETRVECAMIGDTGPQLCDAGPRLVGSSHALRCLEGAGDLRDLWRQFSRRQAVGATGPAKAMDRTLGSFCGNAIIAHVRLGD